MKVKSLSNAIYAFVLVLIIVTLSMVSAKADMIAQTLSPYKCTMGNVHKKSNHDNSDNRFRNIVTIVSDINIRKFSFKNPVEEKRILKEVRRNDVTSNISRVLIVIDIPDCEYPIYKII